MTQEEKELLIKDLCARLSYGVKCQIDIGDADVYVDTLATITIDGCVCFMETIDTEDVLEYGNIKPYLFPLSSMTEEQIKEWNILAPHFAFTLESIKIFAFYHQNHIDYNGLIEKGLAIDATGLNIY